MHKPMCQLTLPYFESAYDLIRSANRNGLEHRLIVEASCACSRLVSKYAPDGVDSHLIAIEKAEAWIRNEATEEMVIKAGDQAWKSYINHNCSACASAAYSAYSVSRSIYSENAASHAERVSNGRDNVADVVREYLK